METKIFNSYSVAPLCILAFFIGLAIMFGVDGITNREANIKSRDVAIECIKQGMAYDNRDCIPYRK